MVAAEVAVMVVVRVVILAGTVVVAAAAALVVAVGYPSSNLMSSHSSWQSLSTPTWVFVNSGCCEECRRSKERLKRPSPTSARTQTVPKGGRSGGACIWPSPVTHVSSPIASVVPALE